MRRHLALALLSAILPLAACQRGPGGDSPLRAPTGLDAVAPDSFVVRFATSRGDIDVMVHRAWAPRGADRLHWLVTHGFYDGTRFFRVVPGFVAQFGVSPDPAISDAWRDRTIADDSVRTPNARGTLTFASAGPDSRTTQLFINLTDNPQLDPMGFAPVGRIAPAGMAVVDSLYGGYGEGYPGGAGPDQARIFSEGEPYLAREFPKLDRIVTATVPQQWGKR
jgi:peptidyl-prolyl cis-trans isomerase A (cyclophilin A)